MSKNKEAKEVAVPPNGGWGISTDDKNPKWICNFYIDVLYKIDSYSSPEAKPISYVKLKLHFGMGQHSEEFIESIANLGNVDWFSKDTRCMLNPDVAPAKAQRYITNHIRKKLPEISPTKQYKLRRPGVHIIEGEPIFCAGGEVIRPPPDGNSNRPLIEPDSLPYTLDFDPNLSEEEAIAETLELISLFPDVGRIILAYNLLYFMRELYAAAWKAPRFCLYIYGLTDSRKTTISTFLSQLYNRRNGIKNPPRLDSSIPKFVKIIYSRSDCVQIFDDLCPSESKDVQRYQEKTFLQTVRIIGDGVEPGRVRGLDKEMPPPTTGGILTGEYLLGVGSDAARMLPIEVAPPSQETLQRLKVFQKDKPFAISTLYRNFIQWFISNYDGVQEILTEWWNAYSDSDFTAHYGLKIHGRLREMHYNLNTAYAMFLEYCCEKEFISEDQAQAMQQSFLKLITELILDQQGRVNHGKLSKPDAKIDYLTYIRRLYLDGSLKLAASAKEFDVKVHDGVIHLGSLCIYGEKFREIIETANVNPDEVLDDLESKGALQSGKDGRTVQIYISAKEKRRFYAIKLIKLQ